MSERVVVSACLAGIDCNYKGESRPHPQVVQMVKDGEAIPVCPEQLGGLSTPRTPAERLGDGVVTKEGEDVTEQFERGADETARICKMVGCQKAILKARSPSCGVGIIYDGTFSDTLIKRDGVTAERLKSMGIEVLSEEDL